MKRSERIEVFCDEIWNWFSANKRELPWRDLRLSDETECAYRILVSEVMLQQTQVSRVKIVYRDFLELFPKINDLARASNRDVILAWRGMGYNSRALRLRDAARDIVEGNFGKDSGEQENRGTGVVAPHDMNTLMSMKGIGHYTAAAIRNFAFNEPTPCLDTNIRRILHRTFVGAEHSDGTWQKDDAYLLLLAGEVLEVALKSGETKDWHAALMDFGSLVCTKNSPKWDSCPLTKKGIMKAAYKTPRFSGVGAKREPGRFVGSKYIPNRIFRGRVVDELRDTAKGLPLDELGRRVCVDWSEEEHRQWLETLVKKLIKDQLVMERRGKYQLA